MSEAPANTLAHNLDNTAGTPLAEILADEILADRERAEQLIETAKTAKIDNDDDAGKVTSLVALIREHERGVDRKREDRKAPFLEAGRAVDAAYNGVIRPLTLARAGENGKGGLMGMLGEYQRRQEAIAAAERQKAAEEQRQREEEAARLQAAADAAQAEGRNSVSAELAARAAADKAAAAGRQAATIRPAPIVTSIATAGTRREVAFEIVEIRKTLSWILKQPIAAQLGHAVRTILGVQIRTYGVDAIERGEIVIPGVELRVEKKASVR